MLREQDLRVDVTLHEATLPDSGIVFELGVLAMAKDVSDVGHRVITQKEDFAKYVLDSELSELEGGFTDKPLHLWTIMDKEDLSSFQSDFTAKVKTLLFTSHVSDIVRQISLDFEGVKVYSIKDTDPINNDELVALSKIPSTCVFLNPERDAKVLYTFSTLLSSYPVLGNQMNITSTTLKSIFETKALRNAFIHAGFSFFLQSQTGAFLWDVYAGGRQIQSSYSYFVLQNQVGASIATWIRRGQPYTDDALLNLKGEVSRDLALLKTQGVIAGYDVALSWVSEQNKSDKVKGIVRGFNVNFNEQYRIAQVHIMINGEV